MIRLSKIAVCAALAVFALLAFADNLLDYGANFEFVRHVLSMDTTFHDPALMGRAVTTPLLWHLFYAAIIAGEGAAGLSLALGTVAMARARREPAAQFEAAKRWAVIGLTLGFLVWFFGFMAVGGEWFAMWQSPHWNGQEAAFRFYMPIIAALIFVTQPDTDAR